MKKSNNSVPMHPAFTITIDVLLTCICIGTFFLLNNVVVWDKANVGVNLFTPVPTFMPTLQPAADPTIDLGSEPVEATPTPIPGLLGNKFAELFTDGEVISTDTEYTSDKIHISLSEHKKDKAVYHVADIYIRDIHAFRAGFSSGEYANRGTKYIADASEMYGAITAIAGDYCQNAADGLVIRDGVMYRNTLSELDICVLYIDGTMETYKPEEVDTEAIIARGAYQAWCFGPELLDKNGMPIQEFTSRIKGLNPRSALGYYEPGHYVFVVVDGRNREHSVGMTLAQLSQLFYELGCTRAYNLDGGRSAGMTWNSSLISVPPLEDGERRIGDILYIKEP